ncbi:MAG TPA: FkbM family methyltransferase [Flavisolibacter sp.]|jgi:FkbM family methyltransferase|nr:FkbM family methyltransferase [Flavisolibacter sp.]
MKTATKIVKSIFRKRSSRKGNFKKLPWVQEKILKHQDDQTIKKVSFEKFTVFYKRPYELLHTYKEIFEKEIYRFAPERQAPLIVDCGANIGLSILYYKQLAPAATIIAFEPDENNFQLLSKNINANKLTNVTLRKEAIWNQTGKISFSANETEASHIIKSETATNLVDSVRLKDFLETVEEIDFLKIDIEGAEWEVIRDCAQSMHHVKNLFLEYHGKANETHKLVDLLQIVKAEGFQVYLKMAADQMQHPFVEKTLALPYDVQLNLFCYR